MAMRRHTWALVIGSGVLGGLLILLATLQVRWLDQVAQTITAQKRAALFRRGTGLADSLGRELSRAFYWFQLEPSHRPDEQAAEDLDLPASGDILARRWRSWRQAGRNVPLVASVWLVGRDEGDPAFRLDPVSGRLQAAAWTRWSELRGPGRGGRPFGIVGGASAAGGPLLAVPASNWGRPPGPPPASSFTVMLELDDRYLMGSLLPALAEEHLRPGEPDGEELLATLVDAEGRRLFSWPAAGGPARPGEHEPVQVMGVRPDLVTPALLAGMSPPSRRPPDLGPPPLAPRRGPGPAFRSSPRGSPPGPPGPRGGGGPPPPGMRGPTWQLSLSYRAGPVDAVVTGLRRRNVALGLSLLALLGGAIAALVVAVRRAQTLAERQRQFMASVSHELRTPLAVIASAAENLRDGTVDDGSRVREYGTMIHAESKRLHAMVDDVLRLAAGGDLEHNLRLEPVDVREVVAAALETFQPELKGRGGRVERSEPDQAPVVAADRQALRHVLENVVGNALKYGGEAPAIAVRISHVPLASGREVQIAVEDQGMGIPADELGQVFDPFFRGREAVSRQIRGTGLGLSLVSRVMKAHGGSVSVDSTPGHGTRFTLRLPASVLEPGAGPLA
jgi:signal transduction histidine kinase